MFNLDSLYARLSSHYKAWSYNKKKHKKIKTNRKCAFYRQRIPESSCARKETVDIDILVTSRNGDRIFKALFMVLHFSCYILRTFLICYW